MKTVFEKSKTNWGCYAEEKKQDQFIKQEYFTIEYFLNTDIILKDKGWFIRNNCKLTTLQLQHFAIGCAFCVLPIYERNYPHNKAPREVLQAAKDYLAGVIKINELIIKRKAVNDAADAAKGVAAAAAFAAYDAAAAAFAADYADKGAADAANDAAYAANADANADSVDYRIILLDFFKEFTKTE